MLTEAGTAIAGLTWLVNQKKCHVVSISWQSSGSPLKWFDKLGDEALASGTIIVAASGNGQRKDQTITQPVARLAGLIGNQAGAERG